jgi:hypothetical protein
MRGERALRVLAPVLRRAEVVDEHERSRTSPDGTVETRQQVVGFRAVPVFDVSQTGGAPLPAPPYADAAGG